MMIWCQRNPLPICRERTGLACELSRPEYHYLELERLALRIKSPAK
jgi:hypothetical protein